MKDTPQEPFSHAHPLVPAAALFLTGAACAPLIPRAGAWVAGLACTAWLFWLVCETQHFRRAAHFALAVTLLAVGTSTWLLNQRHIAADHLVRFTPTATPAIAAIRATVLTPPASDADHTNRQFLAQATALQTAAGWLPVSGDVLVQAPPVDHLSPGTQLELYGWLSRPQPAMNPGGFDDRARLAADRVFVQFRVPRDSGILLLSYAAPRELPWLPRLRAYLRGQLLEHLLPQDAPAAQALTALLLGHHDPAIADVSQAFSDAGIAHLLAISGAHIVFVSAMVWAVLRFLPIRPRWRELLIAAIVGIYILATPCGPPILRAGIGLAMVLLGRFLGRPHQYLNMLAAAAILIVLLRPTDLFTPGFELTFACTAGLIIFSRRVHAALFARRLERLALVAALARTRLARWRYRLARLLAGALTANLIGALTALPLVALHFGQVNLWAAFAGLLAVPVVCLAMLLVALQLLLELVGIGALLSLPAALAGRLLITLVTALAAIPGAAVSVRPPPAWLVLLAYALLIFWAARRRLGLSRATIVNASVALAVLTTASYALTAPVNRAQLTAFDAGNSSSLLLRTPDGQLWSIDTGADSGISFTSQTLSPALRLQGTRRLDGQLLTALDAAHARQAADTLTQFHPRQVLVSQPAWVHRQETLAAWQLASATQSANAPVLQLCAGQTYNMGNTRLHILWPPSNSAPTDDPALILLWEIQGHRLLLLDPASAGTLARLAPVSCDLVIFLGPQRGRADADTRRLLPGSPLLIWTGRGPWSPPACPPGEWNTQDGALTLDLSLGKIQITRATPH